MEQKTTASRKKSIIMWVTPAQYALLESWKAQDGVSRSDILCRLVSREAQRRQRALERQLEKEGIR